MKLGSFVFLCLGAMCFVLLSGNYNIAESMGKKPHKAGDAVKSVNLIEWRDLSAGKIEAKAKNMPVLVDFYTEMDCKRCRALDKEVYSDPKLTDAIKNRFIPVRVILDKKLTDEEQQLTDLLDSGGECVLAFLSPQGKIVKDKKNGKPIATMEVIPPDKYMEYMELALNNLLD
jgi:thiol:disulfide interchange protein